MDGITGQTLKHDTSNWNTFVFIEKEKKSARLSNH